MIVTEGKAVRGMVVTKQGELPDVGDLKHTAFANMDTQIADGAGIVVDGVDDLRKQLAGPEPK